MIDQNTNLNETDLAITSLATEQVNPLSANLDQLNEGAMVEAFIKNDYQVLEALKKAKSQIAKAIKLSTESLLSNASLLYFGAGTSGRLGVLDAAECPPTFSSNPAEVQAFIAGGDRAMLKAMEGAEDSFKQGYTQAKNSIKSKNDLVFGLSASGSAAYVHGALQAAKELGAISIAIANNTNAKSFEFSDHKILLDTGAEMLAGSTRLKAGTSLKLCLNTITTAAMVKRGKTYKNLMVDVNVSNKKLKKRAISLVSKIAKIDPKTAQEALEKNHLKVKEAIVSLKKSVDYTAAKAMLEEHNGYLSKVID